MDSDLTLGHDDMDHEHRFQVRLAAAVGQAIREGRPSAETDEIIDQLIRFTDLHFNSEQLLMRLYAYPEMRDLRTAHAAGDSAGCLDLVDRATRSLDGHIRDRDRAFGDFLHAHDQGGG